MYLRTIGRGFTQMIAYFLVMNSKMCNINSSSAYKKSNADNQLGSMLFVVGYLSFDIQRSLID